MKPRHTWSFSCPINEVDVNRIMKEARYKVVRFTIDGKVYTAWPTRLAYDPPATACLTGEIRKGILIEDTNVSRENGKVSVLLADSDDVYTDGRIRIEAGDHVKAIVDCVTVKVEVFEVPR